MTNPILELIGLAAGILASFYLGVRFAPRIAANWQTLIGWVVVAAVALDVGAVLSLHPDNIILLKHIWSGR